MRIQLNCLINIKPSALRELIYYGRHYRLTEHVQYSIIFIFLFGRERGIFHPRQPRIELFIYT